MLYQHFPSKLELYLAVLDDSCLAVTDDWVIVRGDDLVPSARARISKGADSRARLRFDLPPGWSNVDTPYLRSRDGDAFVIANPERRFDRPVGWIIAGDVGTRREDIEGMEISIAAPKGDDMRRNEMLAFVNILAPELKHALGKLPLKVLILGAGPIGLAVAFWAKRMGAGQVAIQDIADFQEQRALGMGADLFVVDPQDPVGSAERGLGGRADIVFECVGIPGLIDQAVQQVRNRGTILLLGLCTRPDPINSFAMLSKEVRLVTSAFFTVPEYQAALDALAGGAIEPRLLVTDTISLAETPEVFETLKRRTTQCKVLIAP